MEMEEMENSAYRQLYGKVIQPKVRKVLACTVLLREELHAHPTAEILNERVRIATGVSRYTARNYIQRAVDCGLISEEKNGSRKFYFVTLDQLDKASKLFGLSDTGSDAIECPKFFH
jgi:hypothetical protein